MRAAPLAVLFLVAGCVGAPDPAGEPPDGSSFLDQAIRLATFATGFEGVEPTIGVTSSDALFVVAGVEVARSRDGGATWERVTPPVAPPTTFDPYLYVDPATDRVFVSQLTLACTMLSWSDDEGESWTTHPAACGAPLIDHQKLVAGPHPGGAGEALGYRRALYMPEHKAWAALGANAAKVLTMQRSLDGGFTWQTTVPHTSIAGDFRTLGPPVADAEGGVYFPLYLQEAGEDGPVAVAASHDFGETWGIVEVAEGATARRGIDPSLAIDEAGTLLLAYEGADGAVWLSASRDRGASWDAPLRVSPEPLRSTLFAVAVARGEGKVAVAYHASLDTDAAPDEAPPETRWHLYVSFVEGLGGGHPVARTARATPEDRPVQVGPLCGRGVRCGESQGVDTTEDTRNHADFIGIALTRGGRAVVSYVDGCGGGECSTSTRERGVSVAVLEEGPALGEGKDPTPAGLGVPSGVIITSADARRGA